MTRNRKEIDGWISIFETGTDYEADLVRDRLDDSEIPAVLMTKKDRSFSLTQGAMSRIYVMIPPEFEERAVALLQSEALTDDELTRMALAADPENVTTSKPDIDS